MREKIEQPAVVMPLPADVVEARSEWVAVWEAACAGNEGEVENLWANLVKVAPSELSWYYQVFRWLENRAKTSADKLQDLVVLLLQELQEQRDFIFMYDVVRFAISKWPDTRKFGQLAGTALKGRFGDKSWFRSVAGALAGVDLPTGIKRFESLLRLTPGQVWRHHEWGDGIVSTFDLAQKRITVDFPAEKGKGFTFDGAQKFLQHYPDGHVVQMRAVRLDELQLMAREDVRRLVRMIVKDHGGRVSQGVLKTFLHGSVLADSAWTSWWNKARTAISLDPHLDFEGRSGTHAELAWRNTPRTLTDEIRSTYFAEDASVDERVEATSELKRALAKGDSVEPELLTQMLAVAAGDVQNPRSTLMERIQMCMVHWDLVAAGAPAQLSEDLSPESLLAQVDDYLLLTAVGEVDYAVRMLQYLFERDGEEGRARACRLLPRAVPTVAKAIWKELDREAHADEAIEAIQELLALPMENADTYLWAVRGIFKGDWEHLADAIPVSRLVPELVDQLSEWNGIAARDGFNRNEQDVAKKLVATIRQMLQARGTVGAGEQDFAPLRNAVVDMPTDQARELRGAVAACTAFNGIFRSGAERAMLQALEQYAKINGATNDEFAKPIAPPAAETWHWCTRAGFDASMARLSYLQNEAIPQNAVEIETARAEGDLKENAGYHAARERHGMLMDEANIIGEAIANARVCDPKDIKTDKVAFGTRLTVLNLNDDKSETFDVLGRFESDVEKGIISYQTPFMAVFLGAAVGTEVTYAQPGSNREAKYRIVEIAKASALL